MSYLMPFLCFIMRQSHHLKREKHQLEYHIPVSIQVSVYHAFYRVPMGNGLFCVSTWEEKERVGLIS